jgi:hypothetical protein
MATAKKLAQSRCQMALSRAPRSVYKIFCSRRAKYTAEINRITLKAFNLRASQTTFEPIPSAQEHISP